MLQLRVENGGGGKLILYHRPDIAGPKLSDYTIATTEASPLLALTLEAAVDPQTPAELGAILGQSLGELGRVRKQRLLFLVGQTRVHIDTVEGLGHFLELEVRGQY